MPMQQRSTPSWEVDQHILPEMADLRSPELAGFASADGCSDHQSKTGDRSGQRDYHIYHIKRV
jgi:hypothetical protein